MLAWSSENHILRQRPSQMCKQSPCHLPCLVWVIWGVVYTCSSSCLAQCLLHSGFGTFCSPVDGEVWVHGEAGPAECLKEAHTVLTLHGLAGLRTDLVTVF